MQITDCISTKWNAHPLFREQPRKCPSWIGLTHVIKATGPAINLKSYKTKKKNFSARLWGYVSRFCEFCEGHTFGNSKIVTVLEYLKKIFIIL